MASSAHMPATASAHHTTLMRRRHRVWVRTGTMVSRLNPVFTSVVVLVVQGDEQVLQVVAGGVDPEQGPGVGGGPQGRADRSVDGQQCSPVVHLGLGDAGN